MKERPSIVKLWALLLLFILMTMTACSSQPKQPDHHSMHHEQQPIQTGELKIIFHTQPDKPKIKEAVQLTVDIQQGNQPVNDAQVKLELWSKPDHKQTLTTKRTKLGQYQVSTSLSQAGTCQVIVHVVTSQTHQMQTGQFTVSP